MAKRRIVTVEKILDGPNKDCYTIRENGSVAHTMCFDEMLGSLARMFIADKPCTYANSRYPEPREGMHCCACGHTWDQGWSNDVECPKCGVVALLTHDPNVSAVA